MTQENKQSQGQEVVTEEKHKLYVNGMDNIHTDHKAILESALPFFVNQLSGIPHDLENQGFFNLVFELGINIHSLTLTPQERTTFLNTYGSHDALYTKHYLKVSGTDMANGEVLENEAILVGILEPTVNHNTDKKIEEAELNMHSLVLISKQQIIPTHLLYSFFESRKIKLSPDGSAIILIFNELQNTTYLERNTNPQLEEMINKLKNSLKIEEDASLQLKRPQ